MKRGDVAVAFEIGSIEREDALDRIDPHRSDQAGIINFDALDLMLAYNLFPSEVDRRNVRQQSQQVFDAANFMEYILVR